MGEPKFTPGPWEWSRTGAGLYQSGEDCFDEILTAGDDGRPYGMHSAILEMYNGDADRPLIAAAPDLYDALDTANDCLEVCVLLLPQAKGLPEVVKVARAALAKARGES